MRSWNKFRMTNFRKHRMTGYVSFRQSEERTTRNLIDRLLRQFGSSLYCWTPFANFKPSWHLLFLWDPETSSGWQTFANIGGQKRPCRINIKIYGFVFRIKNFGFWPSGQKPKFFILPHPNLFATDSTSPKERWSGNPEASLGEFFRLITIELQGINLKKVLQALRYVFAGHIQLILLHFVHQS